MAVVRIKYRLPAIEPELTAAVEADVFHRKKTKPPPEKDPYADMGTSEIPMDPWQNAKFVTSNVVKSDETQFRKTQQPNVYDRIKIHKQWLKGHVKERRYIQEREKLQRKWQKKLKKAIEAGENVDDVSDDDDEGDEAFDANNVGANADEFAEIGQDEIDEDAEEVKEEITLIMERKYTKVRNTQLAHQAVPMFKQRKLGLSLVFGIGEREREKTEILPWLFVGTGEFAMTQKNLLDLGISHVLNCTEEIPNAFEKNFVYCRLGLKDNDREDAAAKFPAAISFIKRCENSKGKIYIHCTVGSSRAPSMVMAYIVTQRRIALADAFDYMRAMRPAVNPNKHFLAQLAKLEVTSLGGTSVQFRDEWKCFEFNDFIAQKGPDFILSMGLYRTTLMLLANRNREDNLLT